MNDNDLVEWISQNAGPSLKLRLFTNGLYSGSAQEIDEIIIKLMELKEVNTALNYFDAFETVPIENKSIEHLIHYYKDSCIDQFFPGVLDLGFRGGIKVFDEKMQFVANTFYGLLSADYDFCYNYLCMMHRFFFLSGYTTEKINNAMLQRLNVLHSAATEKIFDIYQDGSKLPKPPIQWENRGIIKDELNPFSIDPIKPLPTIYDISALAYFQKYNMDPQIKNKIEDVAEYILDPEFQKLPENYGLIWNKNKRIYHACGWAPKLPLYKGNEVSNEYAILSYLHMMSNFDVALKSEWFSDGLNYLEQFRTEKGTYLFPKEYLWRKILCPSGTSDYLGININCHAAYLNEANMKLKRNERELLIRGLVSTLNVIEIRKKNHIKHLEYN